MPNRGPMPMQFFTPERIRARGPLQRSLPKVLFHWTRSLESALKIISDGVLRGRPGISTSENPALVSPGPVVFVLSPRAILARGFTLWPYLYAPGYEQEAEWVVASGDAEQEDGHIMSQRVELPLRGVVRMIGFTPGWGHPSRRDRARALRAAARARNLPVAIYNWEDWWRGGAIIARRNPRRVR
jgi:hypothetical protein